MHLRQASASNLASGIFREAVGGKQTTSGIGPGIGNIWWIKSIGNKSMKQTSTGNHMNK